MKNIIKKCIKKVFATSIGRKIFSLAASSLKFESMEVLGREHNLSVKFSNTQLPEEIKGFEDLTFLFWSSPLNKGLIRMDMDEAAYLFKLVKSLSEPVCVEIGRFKGGSAFLIASAMNGGRLFSLDLHEKMMLREEGKSYDEEFIHALQKYRLREKVEVVVADSASYDNSKISCDLLFIDGDHSYEGVKKDFEHWMGCVKAGGHIIFHDASRARPFAVYLEGIGRLVEELEGRGFVRKINEVGSSVHFIKD
ncbi:class I SAM-dependent methyltransferase [Candidatus Omnitrophota bacterium]